MLACRGPDVVVDQAFWPTASNPVTFTQASYSLPDVRFKELSVRLSHPWWIFDKRFQLAGQKVPDPVFNYIYLSRQHTKRGCNILHWPFLSDIAVKDLQVNRVHLGFNAM